MNGFDWWAVVTASVMAVIYGLWSWSESPRRGYDRTIFVLNIITTVLAVAEVVAVITGRNELALVAMMALVCRSIGNEIATSLDEEKAAIAATYDEDSVDCYCFFFNWGNVVCLGLNVAIRLIW